MKQYSGVSFDVAITAPEEIATVHKLLDEIISGNSEQALTCYEKWMNQVEGERGGTE